MRAGQGNSGGDGGGQYEEWCNQSFAADLLAMKECLHYAARLCVTFCLHAPDSTIFEMPESVRELILFDCLRVALLARRAAQSSDATTTDSGNFASQQQAVRQTDKEETAETKEEEGGEEEEEELEGLALLAHWYKTQYQGTEVTPEKIKQFGQVEAIEHLHQHFAEYAAEITSQLEQHMNTTEALCDQMYYSSTDGESSSTDESDCDIAALPATQNPIHTAQLGESRKRKQQEDITSLPNVRNGGSIKCPRTNERQTKVQQAASDLNQNSDVMEEDEEDNEEQRTDAENEDDSCACYCCEAIREVQAPISLWHQFQPHSILEQVVSECLQKLGR
jgi:hypothetical protein